MGFPTCFSLGFGFLTHKMNGFSTLAIHQGFASPGWHSKSALTQVLPSEVLPQRVNQVALAHPGAFVLGASTTHNRLYL